MKEMRIIIEGPEAVVGQTARMLGEVLTDDATCKLVRHTGSISPSVEVQADFAKGITVTIETRHAATTAFFSAMSKMARRPPGADVTLTDEEVREIVAEVQKAGHR